MGVAVSKKKWVPACYRAEGFIKVKQAYPNPSSSKDLGEENGCYLFLDC